MIIILITFASYWASEFLISAADLFSFTPRKSPTTAISRF